MMIALDASMEYQQDAINSYLLNEKLNVWHWLESVWLLADVPAHLNPRSLWIRLETIAGPAPIVGLVTTLAQPPIHWGTIDPESWKWLYQFWGAPDFSPADWERLKTAKSPNPVGATG